MMCDCERQKVQLLQDMSTRFREPYIDGVFPGGGVTSAYRAYVAAGDGQQLYWNGDTEMWFIGSLL